MTPVDGAYRELITSLHQALAVRRQREAIRRYVVRGWFCCSLFVGPSATVLVGLMGHTIIASLAASVCALTGVCLLVLQLMG